MGARRDEQRAPMLGDKWELAAVVIVDDVPRRERPHAARVRFLSRAFSADALIKEVGRLLE